MCVDNVQHPRPKCFASVRPRGLNASLCSIPFLSSRADTNAGELEGETGYRRWGRRRPLHHLHLRSWPLHASDRCSPRPLALLPLRAHACGAALTLLASWVPSECAPILSGGEHPPAACPGLCLSSPSEIPPRVGCPDFINTPAFLRLSNLISVNNNIIILIKLSLVKISRHIISIEIVPSQAPARSINLGIKNCFSFPYPSTTNCFS